MAETPVRHFRVDQATWDRAARRAAKDGITISEAIRLFLQGYAKGTIIFEPASLGGKESE